MSARAVDAVYEILLTLVAFVHKTSKRQYILSVVLHSITIESHCFTITATGSTTM